MDNKEYGDILMMSATDVNKKILKKEIKVRELVNLQISKIKDLEKNLNSYITIDEEGAIQQANEVQKLINSGKLKDSKIAGIPISIKDNICTKGIKTTAASRMLENYIPKYNSTVADKIINAGGIIIGKTNLDEFGMGGSTITSYYGKSKNPINHDYTPGGSSGGSASAVASGESYLSLGTDTGGSIRQPASYCGIVGLKPSYGRVSRYGLIPYAPSLDQIGPMTRNVEDAITLFDIIYGYDVKDSNMIKEQSFSVEEAMNKDIKGLRIGLPKEFMYEDLDLEVKDKTIEGISKLEEMGAIVEEFHFDILNHIKAIYYIISCGESSSSLGKYDENIFGNNINRTDGFGIEVKLRTILGNYAIFGENYYQIYEQALKVRRLIKMTLDNAFMKYDLIVGPTVPNLASSFNEIENNEGDTSASIKYTALANLAGIPAISVPNGIDRRGLPIGIQFMAPAFKEEDLLKVAYAFESY